jgi:hypothetical protein
MLPVGVLVKPFFMRHQIHSLFKCSTLFADATAHAFVSKTDFLPHLLKLLNIISSIEAPKASENVAATSITDTATTKGPLIVGSSRRISTLPRSASTGNICSLRTDACSQASDRHISPHTAVQSVAIEDPFIAAPDRVLPTSSSSSVTPTQQDCVQAVQAIITPEQDLSPRQDRLGKEVTPANAQGVHIPAACVFVAK